MIRSTLFRLIPSFTIAAAIIYAFSKLDGPITIHLVVPQSVSIVDDKHHNYSQPPPVYYKPPDTQSQYTPPPWPKAGIPEPQKSILESIASFSAYGEYENRVIERKRWRFSQIPAAQRPLMNTMSYESHFSRAQEQIEVNSMVAQQIARHGREAYGMEYTDASGLNEDYGLVEEAFGHLVRDWTELGSKERSQIFPPIVNALRSQLGNTGGEKKIVVPGFGLGRLAHEIAEMEGFSVTANDIDYTGILTYNYILNHTSYLFDHTFYPFCTKWTQQFDSSSRFQAVKFPDYVPSERSKSNVKLVDGDFLKAFAGEESHEKFDAIVTLFFIDVGENIVEFLERIHSVLKPGGLWINLGPLKWGSYAQIQLSAEEVLQLAGRIGFDVDHDSRQSIDTLYAHQPNSLLKYTYVAQFWTATKQA